jgi:hypothetical protein
MYFYEKCRRVLEKCAQRLCLQDEEKCILIKRLFQHEAEKCILRKAQQRLEHMQCSLDRGTFANIEVVIHSSEAIASSSDLILNSMSRHIRGGNSRT